MFIGLPNATEINSDWNTNTPAPIDNFDDHDNIYDTLISAKKINSSDVLQVIRKISWTSGTIYEMYRHDYDINNTTPQTNSASLYNSNFYAMNSDFRVYECIYNGANPTNSGKGIASLEEPTHTDLQPRVESDGYIWKYLYTVKPSDIVKFDSVDYIPVPQDWLNNPDTLDIRNAAVDGKIETVVIEDTTSAAYQFSGTKNNVPIRGDGYGGTGGSNVGTANQGCDGGDGTNGGAHGYPGAGGGGTKTAGGNIGSCSNGGCPGSGGYGQTSTINGSSVNRGGGGGGGSHASHSPGTGRDGGGNGSTSNHGSSASANTGSGGGGGAGWPSDKNGGSGASGIIILRMPTAKYSGTQSGGTVTTSGSDTIITWTSSGSITG